MHSQPGNKERERERERETKERRHKAMFRLIIRVVKPIEVQPVSPEVRSAYLQHSQADRLPQTLIYWLGFGCTAVSRCRVAREICTIGVTGFSIQVHECTGWSYNWCVSEFSLFRVRSLQVIPSQSPRLPVTAQGDQETEHILCACSVARTPGRQDVLSNSLSDPITDGRGAGLIA